MEMTRQISNGISRTTALAVAVIFVSSIAFAPLALANSSGNSYPMEIVRAHMVYKFADPPAPVSLGLGVHGGR